MEFRPAIKKRRGTRGAISEEDYNYLHEYTNETDMRELYSFYQQDTSRFPVNYQLIKLLFLIYNHNQYCSNTQSYYQDKMNELLEEMCEGCSENIELQDKIKEMCLHFFSLIETIPNGINIKDSDSDDIILWSGRKPDEIMIPPGEESIELPTFISTTINPNVAYEFSALQKDIHGNKEYPVWKIRIPNSHKAQFKGVVFSNDTKKIAVLDASARDLGELEVLIPPFSRFRVIRSDEQKAIVIPEKKISFANVSYKVSDAFTKKVRIYELEYVDYNATKANIDNITIALQSQDESTSSMVLGKRGIQGGKRIIKRHTRKKPRCSRKPRHGTRHRKAKRNKIHKKKRTVKRALRR